MKFLFTLFFAAGFAHAGTLMSVEYRLRPDILRNIQSVYNAAAARADKSQGFLSPVFNDAGTITPYFINCAAGRPDGNGLGCEAVIGTRRSGEAGAVSVSFTKDFSPKIYGDMLAEVEALLKTDANTVDQNDHRHFGNPFSAAAGDVSHLYCVSEGAVPEKSWVCYLYVAERL